MKKIKIKINPFVVLIAIFLVVSFFLLRAESNPIYRFIHSAQEQLEEETKKEFTKNGFYLFRENTPKSLTFFGGCTVNYFDNYVVVINDEYHVYRSSCVGTFYIKKGKTEDLKFDEEKGNKFYVTLDKKKYYKNESINYVKTENKFAAMNGISPNFYKDLFSEITVNDSKVNIRGLTFNVSASGMMFDFYYNEDKTYTFKIFNENNTLYTKNVSKIENLPDLKAFGTSLVLVDALETATIYRYGLTVLSNNGISYNIQEKFPIKVNDTLLTKDSNIIIKYNSDENNYVMLVGNDKKMCYEESDSNDAAYYVFNINYNYLNKGFDKPEFIKIVYKNDGCKYFNEVMGW